MAKKSKAAKKVIRNEAQSQLLRVEIASLMPDANNARTHSPRNIEAIKASLSRFGQQKPIVINEQGVVIAGNGTLLAAKALGWEHIVATQTHLQGLEAMAFSIADNRTAELAEWDFPSLVESFHALQAEGFDLAEIGWAHHEADPLLNSNFTPIETSESERAIVRSISLTEDQRSVFERAVERLRETQSDKSMSEGRCVELLAAEYLS